jgi:hypothetical protein
LARGGDGHKAPVTTELVVEDGAPVRQASLTVAFRDPDGQRTQAFVHGVLTQWRVDPATAAEAETVAVRLVDELDPQPRHPVELTMRLADDGRSVDVTASR